MKCFFFLFGTKQLFCCSITLTNDHINDIKCFIRLLVYAEKSSFLMDIVSLKPMFVFVSLYVV